MSTEQDINKVIQQTRKIYGIKAVKLYALSLSYAGKAINMFRSFQSGNVFWDNQTDDAMKRMFSKAFIDQSEVGWFLSHGVEYGIYLELANDRQNEAIKPIIEILAPQFFRDAKELY